MLSLLQGVLLGAFQGISELFPISSLGHSVILPQVLGWHINEQEPVFLMFLVATHFATVVVLLLFFWKDWVRIVKGIFRSFREREIKESDPDAKLGWLLVAGTIPAGILGLLFKDQIQQHFITASSAALALALNGILLAGAEFLRRRKKESHRTCREATPASQSFLFGRGLRSARCRYSRSFPGFRAPVPLSRAVFWSDCPMRMRCGFHSFSRHRSSARRRFLNCRNYCFSGTLRRFKFLWPAPWLRPSSHIFP